MVQVSLILLHIFITVYLTIGQQSNLNKFPEKSTAPFQVGNKTEESGTSFSNKPSAVVIPAFKDDDVEETFTYQVKRQLKQQWPTSPFHFGFPKEGETVSKLKEDEIKSLKSNLQAMEAKVKNLTMLTELMAKSHNETETQNRVKIDSLQKTVMELVRLFSNQESIHNKTHQNISSAIRDIGVKLAWKADSTQVAAVAEQIKPLTLQAQSLNTNLDILKRQKDESERANKEKMERMDQRISLLMRNVEISDKQNTEKHTNIKASIGQFTLQIQNMSDSIERMEREIEGEERIIESLQDNVYITNQKVSEIASSGGEHLTENTNQCGGILIAQAGLISYKFRQPYENNERCIWTIRANRKEHVIVQLLEDGFQNKSNSDFLTVSHFQDANATALLTISKIGHGDRRSYTFQGPVIFVTFHSDDSIQGKGFLLKYEGSGKSSNPFELNAIKYSHFHLDEPSGFMAYPISKNILYNPNEIATIVINPSKSSNRLLNLTIIPRYADFETETTCQYDSIRFYKSLAASFSLSARFCQQDTILDSSKSFGSEPDGVSIVTFISDSSNQFKGFQFSWNSV